MQLGAPRIARPVPTLALTLALAASLTAPAPGLGDDARPAERPSILFFFADDQRHDTLGCAGHPIVRTPNIDRLAAEGVRFDHAFVTTSICWVSRATVLTGMWSRAFGTADRIDAIQASAAPSMYPRLLREAGYRTGFFGKWHAKLPKGYRQQRHFDVYRGIGRNPYLKPQPDGSARHETQLIGDGAVEFLDSQPAGTPFCLNLWFNAAHAEDGDKRPGIGHFPWPAVVDGMYEDVAMPAPRLGDPEIFRSQPDFLKASLNRVRYFWRWDTPEKYTINMRAYLRMISGVDHVVGRVLAKLEETGRTESTVVVYCADNGYYMGDRGFAGKWSHYEQSLRVPLIIRDPRLPKARRGRVDSHLVLNADLAPTFCDLAGVRIPAAYQGRSLLPLVRGEETSDWRQDLLAEHLLEFGARIPKWEGVRGERYKYARYIEHDHEILHDLEEDPDELRNLADDPAHRETLRRMRARCDELVARFGGPYVPKALRPEASGSKTEPDARGDARPGVPSGTEPPAADVRR